MQKEEVLHDSCLENAPPFAFKANAWGGKGQTWQKLFNDRCFFSFFNVSRLSALSFVFDYQW